VETASVPSLDAATLGRIAVRFHGVQQQTPPMYSALKRDGVPLYALARRGIAVERAPREIRIDALDLAPAGSDAVDFAVRCSKGTYVRVLAADLGRALGTVAHLESLRRTQVGPFHVDAASTLERLQCGDEALPLVGIADALATLRRFTLDPAALATLRHGQQSPLRTLPRGPAGEVSLVLDAEGAVAGIVEMDPTGAEWRIVRLLALGEGA